MQGDIQPEGAARAAIEFVPAEGARIRPALLELVPHDVLVLWEDERTDRYKRVVGLVIGNKLKLVKLTVGRVNAMEILCEAPIADEATSLRTQFITRDALLLWAEPREPRGFGKTLVVRVGSTLKMVRVTADDTAPSIEILQSLEAGD
jgi:hypothetical protein